VVTIVTNHNVLSTKELILIGSSNLLGARQQEFEFWQYPASKCNLSIYKTTLITAKEAFFSNWLCYVKPKTNPLYIVKIHGCLYALHNPITY